jgi:heme-degrading monooxygenase HmoA
LSAAPRDRWQVEFVVVTLWESTEAIKQFAGSKPEVAIVEPEARASLSSLDNFMSHYEVFDSMSAA